MNHDMARVRIGLVGPRGVGKTSLLTSILAGGREALAGMPVTLEAADGRAQNRIDRFENKLQGWVMAGEFRGEGLGPTTAPDELPFHLAVSGDHSVGVRFDVMDYPGGWLAMAEKPAGWTAVDKHIRLSTVLIVPIDATYVMEAVTPAQRQQLPDAVYLSTVKRVVTDWAKSRNSAEHRAEPAVLILAPVKCEAYFSDNGGQLDQSRRLHEEVSGLFAGVIKQARNETRNTRLQVWYCPVDTIGCIDLEKATWKESAAEPWTLEAKYDIRRPPTIHQRGARELLYVIAEHVVNAERQLSEASSEKARAKAEHDAEKAEEDRGFFGNIWCSLTGKRAALRKKAKAADAKAETALARLDQIDKALSALARRPHEGRLSRMES